ncbi:MAG TPA: trehalase family glycosidase [Spirochaetia bacterium]|nr:trehalase family glycosidase [Spirochaetia bacterium]
MNRMYTRAIEIARSKINGGPDHPTFRRPYLDAAFFGRLFYWDTCFIASWAKYHIDELPIEQSLDNFYTLQDDDGFICREYSPEGVACWPREHPVSTNPPLLAFAELELYSQSGDVERLRRVYPNLKREFEFRRANHEMEDGLYYCDGFGSGMDNVPRYPDGWTDDGQGIPLTYRPGLGASDKVFSDISRNLSTRWNTQGRMIDINCQMVLCARSLAQIVSEISRFGEVSVDDEVEYNRFAECLIERTNDRMWSDAHAFYFDLAHGEPLERFHIGAYWALLAGVVPNEQAGRFVAHLLDPAMFCTNVSVPSMPRAESLYDPDGEYWRGGVWPPATYMVLRGLRRYGFEREAKQIAQSIYACVTTVFNRDDTFYEFYKPEAHERGYVKDFDHHAVEDFCGWSALVPISIYREFL